MGGGGRELLVSFGLVERVGSGVIGGGVCYWCHVDGGWWVVVEGVVVGLLVVWWMGGYWCHVDAGGWL